MTGSLDATVRVWRYADCSVQVPSRHVLHAHDDTVSCVAVSVAHDVVVSGRYAHASMRQLLRAVRGEMCHAFTTMAPCVFACSNDGTVVVHQLATGEYIRSLQRYQPPTNRRMDGHNIRRISVRVWSLSWLSMLF